MVHNSTQDLGQISVQINTAIPKSESPIRMGLDQKVVPGAYELRYVGHPGSVLLATRPITIEIVAELPPVVAALEESVEEGSEPLNEIGWHDLTRELQYKKDCSNGPQKNT